MTLRLRLAAALVALVAVGLAVFGLATYRLYADSQYQRLDSQVRSSVPLVTGQLRENAGIDGGPAGGGTFGGGGGPGHDHPPVVVAPGTYAELRGPTGTLVANLGVSSSSSVPKLPAGIVAGDTGRFLTVDSATGTGSWRVYVVAADQPRGDTVVVAVPMTEVDASLNRLVIIEVTASAALVALLGCGAWLVLRRGLRPLEQMATSARSIAAGDLSERVSPSDGTTEVGQLGLALNTMLDEIEEAFGRREATERRLRQFLSDASHELRTPLTSIQGFAELFRMGADEDRVQLGVILRRIEEESARMKTLVEDLLLLARLDETRPAEREPVDLAVLAADACSDAVATAPDREVTLDAPAPAVILGDRDHLRQAIANLVTNAVRHTPDGSPIEVSARVSGATVEVSVRDHGPGLDDDALAHVFDRFWQADRARVGSGSGLGLSIVAAIADEHGGAASVANAPDGGARFTLRFPLEGNPALDGVIRYDGTATVWGATAGPGAQEPESATSPITNDDR